MKRYLWKHKCKDRKTVLNVLKVEYSHSQILSTKQVIENLPIAVAQVKADNTSESLLNEIHQKLCSLFKQNK